MGTPPPLAQVIDAGWAQALAPVKQRVHEMGRFLREELATGRGYLPAGAHVLRAFTFPLSQVRVLIVRRRVNGAGWVDVQRS